MALYRVADANQLLVVTGLGISDFVVKKKHLQLPFQRVCTFCVTPVNYEIDLQALSHEKLAMRIKISMTIGPNYEQQAELNKYIRLLVSNDSQARQEEQVKIRINGILEGELRGVAAQLAIEEIFNNRKMFQSKVSEYITAALEKFGLQLLNCNIERIADESQYFETQGKKAQAGAIAASQIQISESKALQEIGVQERVTRATKETSRLQAETTVWENTQAQLVAQSKSELEVKQWSFNAAVSIATIEGQNKAKMCEADLQKDLQKRLALVETERLRAETLAKAQVDSERVKVQSDAEAYRKQTIAEAVLFENQKVAEGLLYAKEKEALGIEQLYKAQANGLQSLISSFANPSLAIQYLMLEKGLFVQLAEQNAKAVQNLNPKFNIWTTGASGDGMDAGKPIRDLFQALPPLLTTIQDQTGITAPSWVAQMPQVQEAAQAKRVMK